MEEGIDQREWQGPGGLYIVKSDYQKKMLALAKNILNQEWVEDILKID